MPSPSAPAFAFPGAVVVTGGSRGIGAATACLAARRGQPVGIVYRSRKDEADAVVRRIEEAGGQAIAVQADVALERDVMAAFSAIEDRFGRIGSLVNNAGITGGVARATEVSQTQLAELYAVNIGGALLCVREAARRMATDGGGTGGAIVNVSSRASVAGGPGTWVHYAASKGAMDTMTVGLAKELAASGIRVNGVRPGLIDTEIHAPRAPGALERLVRNVPMRRMGTPDEVASVIVWLLSDEAAYVTGALVDVAGGV